MGESIDWKRVTAIWRASGRTSGTVAEPPVVSVVPV